MINVEELKHEIELKENIIKTINSNISGINRRIKEIWESNLSTRTKEYLSEKEEKFKLQEQNRIVSIQDRIADLKKRIKRWED